jgi:1-deoxy-D-xylulose-5-phosphate reductoisomerase
VEKKRFPALSLSYGALREGGTMAAVLNGANEIAVTAFLGGRIGFREIHRIIDMTMQQHTNRPAREVGEILEVDRWARERAALFIR